MKFVKSNLAKKLIIILIVLMIFNVAIPHEVKAWNIGGILLKPISSMVLSLLVTVDVSVGVLLNGISVPIQGVGAIIEAITGNQKAALTDANSAIQKLFIGPDTIFSGKVRLLNANIFEVSEWEDLIDVKELDEATGKAISSSTSETLGDLLSPRK